MLVVFFLVGVQFDKNFTDLALHRADRGPVGAEYLKARSTDSIGFPFDSRPVLVRKREVRTTAAPGPQPAVCSASVSVLKLEVGETDAPVLESPHMASPLMHRLFGATSSETPATPTVARS